MRLVRIKLHISNVLYCSDKNSLDVSVKPAGKGISLDTHRTVLVSGRREAETSIKITLLTHLIIIRRILEHTNDNRSQFLKKTVLFQ